MKSVSSISVLGILFSVGAFSAPESSLMSCSRTIPAVEAALSSGIITAIAVKLDGSGATVLATYLGGNGCDRATSIELDDLGNIIMPPVNLPLAGGSQAGITTVPRR